MLAALSPPPRSVFQLARLRIQKPMSRTKLVKGKERILRVKVLRDVPPHPKILSYRFSVNVACPPPFPQMQSCGRHGRLPETMRNAREKRPACWPKAASLAAKDVRSASDMQLAPDPTGETLGLQTTTGFNQLGNLRFGIVTVRVLPPILRRCLATSEV